MLSDHSLSCSLDIEPLIGPLRAPTILLRPPPHLLFLYSVVSQITGHLHGFFIECMMSFLLVSFPSQPEYHRQFLISPEEWQTLGAGPIPLPSESPNSQARCQPDAPACLTCTEGQFPFPATFAPWQYPFWHSDPKPKAALNRDWNSWWIPGTEVGH